jgi:hypothetical protein
MLVEAGFPISILLKAILGYRFPAEGKTMKLLRIKQVSSELHEARRLSSKAAFAYQTIA